ncbi:hypothetical protein SORBI_3001G005400 [Sorghum bicolor]|uniref:Uncharacterized protein n=1 Tax=Sorghum bicolor TaxID=4558 RepID=A0A1Z5S4A8_SORBI|nr:hypothetical protein SORBI_3001G005400 [Sorghum bicolor]
MHAPGRPPPRATVRPYSWYGVLSRACICTAVPSRPLLALGRRRREPPLPLKSQSQSSTPTTSSIQYYLQPWDIRGGSQATSVGGGLPWDSVFLPLRAVYVQPSCMCVCPFTTSTDLHVHLLVERASDPCIWPDIYTAKDCFVFYVDSCIFTTSVVGNWESSRGPTLSGACPVGVDRHLEHW